MKNAASRKCPARNGSDSNACWIDTLLCTGDSTQAFRRIRSILIRCWGVWPADREALLNSFYARLDIDRWNALAEAVSRRVGQAKRCALGSIPGRMVQWLG